MEKLTNKNFAFKKVCPVCKSAQISINLKDISVQPYLSILNKPLFCIYQCKACKINFLNPVPALKAIASLYPKEYYAPVKIKAPSVVSNIGKTTYLEIGCGNGDFFKKQYENSIYSKYVLVDLNPFLLKKLAKLKNVETILSDLDSLKLPTSEFDYMELSHVLEHVMHPDLVLQKLVKGLKKNGILRITVPRFDGLSTLLLKNRAYFSCPQHLYFYTPVNIKVLLEQIQNINYKITFSFGNVLVRDMLRIYPVLNFRFIKWCMSGICFILENVLQQKENMIIAIEKK